MASQFSSVINTLIDAMQARLEDELVDIVTDETQVGLVRFGKLQADPTDAPRGLNILIHTGGEDWPDVLYTGDQQSGFFAPTYEIGGTQWWMRRFIIEFVFFYDFEQDRQVARIKSQTIFSHAHKAIYTMNDAVPTDADSFGEQAQFIQVKKMTTFEGGGEGTFIWRGKLWIEWLTTIQNG